MLRDPLGPCFAVAYRDISVVVGEVTQSTFTSRSGVIEWDAPTSPPPRISKETQAMGLENFFGGGGSGIVMGDGTIVFPLTALLRGDSILFIIYSKEKCSTWVVAKVFFPARCFNPAPPKGRGEKYS
ncbi:putative trans-sialidase [Trypanosoma cruzi]|nr:putative trans-sialidase [Trypanosoma cruzi]